jgi:hypothetical protein
VCFDVRPDDNKREGPEVSASSGVRPPLTFLFSYSAICATPNGDEGGEVVNEIEIPEKKVKQTNRVRTRRRRTTGLREEGGKEEGRRRR